MDTKRTRRNVRIALAIYFLLLIKLIVFKNPAYIFSSAYLKDYGLHLLKLSWSRANFIPFKTLYYYISGEERFQDGVENILGNIVLFIPYGFLLPVAYVGCSSLIRFLIVIILTSLSFETMQLLLAYGNFDVDDILLNAIGGVIGFLL